MLKRTLLMACAILLLVSCAKPYKEQIPEMYWPMPPAQPRVKFLDMIIGSIDVTRHTEGRFSTLLFGEGGEAKFLKPNFIAVKNNIIYVTDLVGIHVYDYKRNKYRLYASGLSRSPTGIDVDSKGNIYIADSGSRNIFILDKNGKTKKKISDKKKFSYMGGVFVDEERGRFFVANTKKHNIEIFDLDGQHLFTFGEQGNGPGYFNYPYDVAVDSEGDIIVLDSGNFRVQIFDSEFNFIREFGSVGTTPGQFARPKSLDISSDGHLFIVDAAFGNFQIFDKKGRVYLSVGNTGMLHAEFLLPMGIAIGEDDRIYVVDQLNRRLQVFQYLTYE